MEKVTITFTDKKKGWIKVNNEFKQDENIIIQNLFIEEIEEILIENEKMEIIEKEFGGVMIKTLEITIKNEIQVELFKKIKEEIIKECIKKKYLKESSDYFSTRNLEFKRKQCKIKIDLKKVDLKNLNSVKIDVVSVRIDKNKNTLNIIMELE